MKNKFKNRKENNSSGFAGIIALLTACSLVLILTFSLSASLFAKKQISRNLSNSLKSFYLAESGAEDAVLRVLKNYNYISSDTFTLDSASISRSIVTNGGTTTINVSSSLLNNVRKLALSLTVTTSAVSFFYGVQVGEGGVVMGNGSSIIGNLYSDGPISGGGKITGDVVVANGMSLSEVTVKGTAKSNSIVSSKICGDAYYQSINATSLNFLNNPTSPTCSLPLTPGTAHPGSPDMPAESMPITPANIADWKAAAEAGGIYSGPCTLTSNITLGPVKVNCANFEISNGKRLTITGTIWVAGNLNISNNGVVELASGYGGNSGVMIADKPGSEATSGIIETSNNAIICGSNGYNSGSGTCNVSNGTYVLLLSTHSGATDAITIGNNADGAIYYAANGIADISNNANVKEITAYQLTMTNNTTVTYESGLASASFSSGPGGGWVINSWNETQ